MGFGSGTTCWRRLRDWQKAGVWARLHELLLDGLREAGQFRLRSRLLEHFQTYGATFLNWPLSELHHRAAGERQVAMPRHRQRDISIERRVHNVGCL